MTALYILLTIAGLFLVVPAILPGKYSIEKAITINATQAQIFNKVADLRQYRDWNPWQKMEPDAKTEIAGTPATIGHKFHWLGKKIGEGSLTVKRLNIPSEVTLDLQFIKPWKSQAIDQWHFEKINENTTKVIWKNNGPLNYPVARLMGPVINKNLNKQFEQGLLNLKEVCEKNS